MLNNLAEIFGVQANHFISNVPSIKFSSLIIHLLKVNYICSSDFFGGIGTRADRLREQRCLQSKLIEMASEYQKCAFFGTALP